MSRIGKMPVVVPAGVEVKIGADVIEVKGPKGQISTPVCNLLSYEMKDGHIILGLRRTLLHNCILGVTQGFSKSLEVIGVGYRVAVKGNMIELSVGYSHPVLVDVPDGIKASVEGNVLTLTGCDKDLIGEFASRIRRVRLPEPYKGKGIKYTTETIRRKVGKSGGKK